MFNMIIENKKSINQLKSYMCVCGKGPLTWERKKRLGNQPLKKSHALAAQGRESKPFSQHLSSVHDKDVNVIFFSQSAWWFHMVSAHLKTMTAIAQRWWKYVKLNNLFETTTKQIVEN